MLGEFHLMYVPILKVSSLEVGKSLTDGGLKQFVKLRDH